MRKDALSRGQALLKQTSLRTPSGAVFQKRILTRQRDYWKGRAGLVFTRAPKILSPRPPPGNGSWLVSTRYPRSLTDSRVLCSPACSPNLKVVETGGRLLTVVRSN